MNPVVEIMATLRGKGGCPWDRKQTLRTLKRCVVEEAYEVCEAIDSGKNDLIEEELGDLLCVVGLMTAIGEDKGLFTRKSIVARAVRKMTDRHPHVFGDAKARTASDALRIFQKAKEKERQNSKDSLLHDVGRNLPALLAAQKIQKKVSRVGFDWEDARGVLKKVEEELKELKVALKQRRPAAAREELGDLFFSMTALATKLELDAETTLLTANRKFKNRFQRLEKKAGKLGYALGDPGLTLEKLDGLWEEVKQEERRRRRKKK